MLKIQYASDLHLEYPKNRDFLAQNPIQPAGDILILAGDIVTNTGRHKIQHLYDQWQQQFKYIISIPGNHEFYGSDVAASPASQASGHGPGLVCGGGSARDLGCAAACAQS